MKKISALLAAVLTVVFSTLSVFADIAPIVPVPEVGSPFFSIVIVAVVIIALAIIIRIIKKKRDKR